MVHYTHCDHYQCISASCSFLSAHIDPITGFNLIVPLQWVRWFFFLLRCEYSLRFLKREPEKKCPFKMHAFAEANFLLRLCVVIYEMLRFASREAWENYSLINLRMCHFGRWRWGLSVDIGLADGDSGECQIRSTHSLFISKSIDASHLIPALCHCAHSLILCI